MSDHLSFLNASELVAGYKAGQFTPDDVVAAARHVWRDDGAVTALLTPAEGSR